MQTAVSLLFNLEQSRERYRYTCPTSLFLTIKINQPSNQCNVNKIKQVIHVRYKLSSVKSHKEKWCINLSIHMTENMTDSFQESFNIPPGFTVEEIKGQLYHDDLEEDDEFWLIRMPCDIELSNLDKRKIFLSDETGGLSIKNFKTESGKSLECCAETCEISNTSVVLPNKQDGNLHTVKKAFKGSVLISEGLSLNNQIEIKSEKEDSYLNDSCSIIESNGEKVVKTKKKSRSDLDTSELNIKNEDVHEQCEDGNNSSSKKRKSAKKKRHSQTDFDSSEFNYETEAAENVDSPNSQKKKKHSKSRKSSEKLEIKGEPISMDLDDGFPTCSSQK